MSIKYDAGDLICNMIELEKCGYEFYSKYAEQSENFTIKELFFHLAEEEKIHQSIYEQIRKETHVGPEAEEDDSYEDYLKHIIDENFDFNKKLDPKSTDTKCVLDMAIRLEMQSLSFITEYSALIGSAKVELLEKIKNEERNHLKMIQEVKAQL